MKLAYITPTHNPQWLGDVYQSLQRQTDPDWEWHIFRAPGVDVSLGATLSDPRVFIHAQPVASDIIGQIKQACFMAVEADLLAELDHDDLLAPEATAEIKRVFVDPDVGFAYSDSAAFLDGTGLPFLYDPACGWSYRRAGPDGAGFACNSFELTPRSLSMIFFAPNHIRVWRAGVYRELGGHDPALKVCDDQDLVCRSYLATKFAHIPRPLYFYREHPANSYKAYQDDVQRITLELHDRYIEALCLRWARFEGLLAVDLCSGPVPAPGYVGVDRQAGAHLQANLNLDWPFADGSVGVIRAVDALEHLRDPIHAMNEAYRVLAHGGWLLSETPSTDGRGAFQDPTHVSFWNANSFWYYTSRDHARYVPAIACRFQRARVLDHFPSEFHRTNNIAYVRAHLCAIKEGPRLPGLIEI